jgi:DNA polymerase-3 subunit alpha
MAAESQATGVPFVHLRAHSAYSLSEGALPIKQMAKLAADMGMPALAITDTGNLFGALEFSEAMVEKGVQPIIGITLQVDFGDTDRDHAMRPGAAIERFPVVALLAKDETGYGNLMRLSSKAFLETPDNAEPHIAFDLLVECAQGLICLSGGPNGPIDGALRQQHAPLARDRLLRLRDAFGDRLYVELQRHGSDDERLGEEALVGLAFELDLPVVATNEPYFARPEDYAAHDALLCIADGEVLATADRRHVTTEHYFKTPQEMAALFADIPEAIDSTMEIARRCAFFVKSHKPILPRFAEGDEAALLREEARAGLEARFAERPLAAGNTREDYLARLEFELDVIIKMKFPGYFLIVADFVKHAKSKGIPVGPGRGSGAGSLVAYSLTITDLDPIRFNLLFERFLNPERVSMPDFDIDFCQDRRDEVIDYVQERHGKERVAQIITFGKLQARAVCRDVGRVLQMPYGQVDRLCKLIPMNPANPVTLAQAIEGEPRFQEERDRDPVV